MKISEAFEFYIDLEIIGRGLSPKTHESYIYAEKLATSYFENAEICDINLMDISGYYRHLLSWQKPDTARGNIICLRSVLKRCSRECDIVIDPEDIKVPKREKRIVKYLTETEMALFIECASSPARGLPEVNRLRNIAIVKLLCCTGIRAGELCALNRNSIKNRQFTVVGKSKNPRICFITIETEQAINSYLQKRKDKERALFISNQTGKRLKVGNLQRIFRNICSKSGQFEGVHPHTIRHSFATLLLNREVDLRYIADLMGHESLDTTKMYTHFANPKLKKIYESAMGK